MMGRVLYFHHYFPALMFCCMLGGKLPALVFCCMLGGKLSTLAFCCMLGGKLSHTPWLRHGSSRLLYICIGLGSNEQPHNNDV